MSTEERCDLDLADLDEVRRRVVGPVLNDLIRPGELQSVELIFDYSWPPHPADPAPLWQGSGFGPRPGEAPKNLYLVLSAGTNDWQPFDLGAATFFRSSAEDIVDTLTGNLYDWIAESRFGWGEARVLSDAIVIPPAMTHVDGRPVVVLDVDVEYDETDFEGMYDPDVPDNTRYRPVLDVGGEEVEPATLALSLALLDAIGTWTAGMTRDVDELQRALDRQDRTRFGTDLGDSSGGISITYHSHDEVQAMERTARALVVNAHLGPWRQLVETYEPQRDALVERLRTELGPAFHVPVPPRIP